MLMQKIASALKIIAITITGLIAQKRSSWCFLVIQLMIYLKYKEPVNQNRIEIENLNLKLCHVWVRNFANIQLFYLQFKKSTAKILKHNYANHTYKSLLLATCLSILCIIIYFDSQRSRINFYLGTTQQSLLFAPTKYWTVNMSRQRNITVII